MTEIQFIEKNGPCPARSWQGNLESLPSAALSFRANQIFSALLPSCVGPARSALDGRHATKYADIYADVPIIFMQTLVDGGSAGDIISALKVSPSASMISLLKTLTSVVSVLAILLMAGQVFGQAGGFQSKVHEIVDRYKYSTPKGDAWEGDKKLLNGFSQDELAHGLLNELSVDRGDYLSNEFRDMAVSKLFKALGLPHTLVIEQLREERMPDRKASLIYLLNGDAEPAVTELLLHQITDRRPAAEIDTKWQIIKPHAFRVCDVAMIVLAHNLGARGFAGISKIDPDTRRDQIIKDTLAELQRETGLTWTSVTKTGAGWP